MCLLIHSFINPLHMCYLLVLVTGRNLLTDPRWGTTQTHGLPGDSATQNWLHNQACIQPPGKAP